MDKQKKIGKNEFKCENCHGIFNKGWTDEEASKEAESLWGKKTLEKEGISTICDDCFIDYYSWAVTEGLVIDKLNSIQKDEKNG